MYLPILLGIGFTLFGLYMLRHATRSYGRAVQSLTWPSVDGKLVRVDLWGNRNIDGEAVASKHLSIEYEYHVDEVLYEGEVVAFYTLMYPETLVYANKHPVNSNVMVYYDPENPINSVLIPGLRKDMPYSDLIIAGLGIITGVGVVIGGWLGSFE